MIKKRSTIIALVVSGVLMAAAVAAVANNLFNIERIRNVMSDATDVRVAVAMEMDDYVSVMVPSDSRIDVIPDPGAVTKIYAPLDGRIIQSERIIGGMIKAGEVIATYDTTELNVQKMQAAARTGAAEARLKQAEREYSQEQELYAQQATSRDKMSKAGELVSIEQQNLVNEQAGTRLIDDNFLKKQVRSPVSGFVASVFLRDGMQITRGQILCDIINPDKLVLECEIRDAQAKYLRADEKVKIETIRGIDGRQIYEGRIVQVGKSVHVQGEYTHIFINLANVENILRSKQVFSAAQSNALDSLKSAFSSGFVLHLSKPRRAVVVPRYAVMYKNGEPYIYVDKDNVAEQLYIELGTNFGDDYVEAIGVKLGDKIITVGNDKVSEGRKIRVVNAGR